MNPFRKQSLDNRNQIWHRIIHNLIEASVILPSESDKYVNNILQKLDDKDLLAVLEESRILAKTQERIRKYVEAKALEQVRVHAQKYAREFLCRDCLDKRCLTGSICRAFIIITDQVAWEIIAEKAELN